MKLGGIVTATILVILSQGCVSTKAPVEEFNLAVVALDAAKEVQAAKYAGGYYHKAEESLRRGQILFQNREYDKAREEFDIARKEAEKAENAARVIRWKNGEVL